jgi:hypothetical protein
MEVIISIVLVLFVCAAIVILIAVNRKDRKKIKEGNVAESEPIKKVDPTCCGAHEVCEFDKVKVNVDLIEYFEDEELDRFKGIAENDYSDDQIEEFREVLYTLKINEIQNWLLSLQRRRVHLPEILQSEARDLIVNG